MDALETLADSVRQDFPFFERTVAGDGCIYLDNAATSLRPRAVIEKLEQFYSEISASVARATYMPAELATHLFESTRAAVAQLVRFEPTEIVVTSGCTSAVNLVAAGLPLAPGKAVALSLFEHHANVLPWMSRYPLLWFDPMRDGVEQLDHLLSTNDVGLLAVTACSNVCGAVLPVQEYATVAHEHGIPVVADAAQLAPHFWEELRRLDADFVVLSPHKMLGPFAIGALCARGEWLERLEPPWLGGGSVEEVTCTSYRLRTGPARFESGTPPVAQAAAFGEALDYFRSHGPDEIARYEGFLLDRLLDRLRGMPRVRIVDDEWEGLRAPVVSIYVEDELVSTEQLSRMLYDRFKVCVRAGHHCAHPYISTRGLPGALRISASFYNTPEEIDRACDAVGEILDVLL